MRLSFETAIGDVSPGDILQYLAADIPMCEFWQPNDPHWGGLETKPISPTASAAHIYGKPRVAAEAFTNIGPKVERAPISLKHFADRTFSPTASTTLSSTHTRTTRWISRRGRPSAGGSGRRSCGARRGGSTCRCSPTTLRGANFCLQQGHPVADVLWYLGDDLDHKPRQDAPFPTATASITSIQMRCSTVSRSEMASSRFPRAQRGACCGLLRINAADFRPPR